MKTIKKTLAAGIVAGMLGFGALAQTTHTVTCQNGTYHFLPVTVNAVVGDIMHWVWVSGDHVVGPITASDIPPMAPMWNCPIDAYDLTCDYVLQVAGNYHYVCHPATPHGEDAYIVVTAAAGVQQYNSNNNISIYPNPASSSLQVTLVGNVQNTSLVITDMLGNTVKQSIIYNLESIINIADLAEGVYTISIGNNEGFVNKRLVIVK